jgi:hypothetical protein
MPSEANQLPLPDPASVLDEIFDEVDQCVRARNFADAVELVDETVLPRWAKPSESQGIKRALQRLIARRRNRGAIIS